MIFRRTVANLRAQNWTAIVIEIAIVITGVFIGNQVSNWNDERIRLIETGQVLRDLKPELGNLIANFRSLRSYYGVTRTYADTAFAGWNGEPGVSDRDFVIAAYQASQNTFTGVNNSSWSQIFGSDRLRDIKDRQLREQLSVLMTTDFAVLEKEVFTNYRESVRKVIPEDIQDAIRAQCGDQRVGSLGFVRLPPTCSLRLPDERFQAAARALRQRPDLAGELRWHFAAVASYVDNILNLEMISRRAHVLIDRAPA